MIQNKNFFKVVLTNENTAATIEATEQSLNLWALEMVFRRTSFHGITILFNQPLECAFESKDFLQSAYNTDGADALVKVDLYINYNESFVFLSSQYVDFATFTQNDRRRNFPVIEGESPDFVTVQAELIPYGIEQKFLDRFGDTFTMAQEESTEGQPLSVKDLKTIDLIAKPFQLQNKGVINSGLFINNSTSATTATGIVFDNLKFSEGVSELTEWENDFTDEAADLYTECEFTAQEDSNDITFKSEFVFNYNITIESSDLNLTKLNSATFTIGIYDNGGLTSEIYSQSFTANFLQNRIQLIGTVNVNYTDTANYLQFNRKAARIGIAIDRTNNGGGIELTATATLNITNVFASIQRTDTAPDSNVQTHMIEEIILQGVEVSTDQQNNLLSALYGRIETGYDADGKASLRFLANGEQIRKVLQPKPFQLSLKALLTDLNGIDCIGLDFLSNNIVRIENRETFYKSATFWSFENIAEIKTRFADEATFRRVNGGYSIYLSEDEFSLNDEMNQEREWITENKNIRNLKTTGESVAYDIKAKNLCASSWAREKQRREPLDDKKKDFDDTNFIECVRYNDSTLRYETETNEPFTAISGVFSPNEFPNLRITPLRNLQRHLKFLYHIFWKKDYSYKLAGWNGNTQAETTADDPNFIINATPVKEDDPQPFSLATALFSPEIIEFTAPLSLDFIFAIQNTDNVYKQIQVSDQNDNFLSGWLYKDGLNVNFDPEQGFTMRIKLIGARTAGTLPLCEAPLNPNELYLNSLTGRMRYQYDGVLNCWIYQDTP